MSGAIDETWSAGPLARANPPWHTHAHRRLPWTAFIGSERQNIASAQDE